MNSRRGGLPAEKKGQILAFKTANLSLTKIAKQFNGSVFSAFSFLNQKAMEQNMPVGGLTKYNQGCKEDSSLKLQEKIF